MKTFCRSLFIPFLWFQIDSSFVLNQPIQPKNGHKRHYTRSESILSLSDREQWVQQQWSISKAHSSNYPPIIACSSTIEMIRAISMYIRSNDTILELGSQLSQVSTHLSQTIGPHGKAILVDVHRSDAKSGRTINRAVDDFVRIDDTPNKTPKFKWASFIELQHFHQWRTSLNVNGNSSTPISFDAMILDIAASIGNDLYMTALATAEEFMHQQQILDPSFDKRLRVIIVKSRNLSSLARRLVHSQRLFDTTVELPLNLNRTHDPYIIASVGVEEYRRTIPHVVRPGDSCIEVGCHFGRTTLALYNSAVQDPLTGKSYKGFCIGVDIGAKIIDHAKKELPHIPFAVADAWRVMDLIKLRKQFIENTASIQDSVWGYDIVYADLGGLSGPDGLLESLALIDALAHGLEPRVIVIKSLCLNRLASRLRALTNEWQKWNVVNLS